MGDESSYRPHTLVVYSRYSYEGYRNAIELPEGAKVSPIRSDTIQLDLIQEVPQPGLDLWLQVKIFSDHVNYTTQMAIDYAAGGRIRKLWPEVA
nr:zinc finger, CCHC-type [Tanacetum cinerariifolium]